MTRHPIEAVFDARGVGQARLTDAMGRLVEVREDADYFDLSSPTVTAYRQYIDASAPYVQRWKYYTGSQIYQQEWVQASSRLYNVIQQGVQTRTFERDTLGRVESESHPESGTTFYAWSDGGRLQSKTDARGIVTNLGYDALGRPLTIDYSDGTPSAWYEYDQGAHGIGRLTSSSNANASDSHVYDAMGRVTHTQKTVGGMLFMMSTTYNYAGLPASATLPDGTVITNSHDRMGRLTQVASDRVDATHPAVLASNFVYHPGGSAKSIEWGNGTVTQTTLNESHQLKTLKHGPAANPEQFIDFEYDYDEGVANTHRIMAIIDHNDPSKTVNYTYDEFNRLKTAATVGSHWGLSWTYDRYGNRLSQTKTKGAAPTNSLSVNAGNNRVGGWSYDVAGNTLNDGEHEYTYDANHMIKSVDGAAVQYKYDAAGQRVSKVTAAETVHYVFGSEYSTVSGWKRVFVSAGGIKVEYRANQTYFHQLDHLGTPRAQTDSAGNLVETWSYYPFGEQWQQSGSGGNEHRITGHRRDPETGHDYAGARYLKNSRGRWLSIDPALGDITAPQRLNRYSYVLNDPVNLVDEDGREWRLVNCREIIFRIPPSGGDAGGGALIPSGVLVCELRFFPPAGAGAAAELAYIRQEKKAARERWNHGDNPFPPFSEDDIKRVAEALLSALELLSDEDCDGALKSEGIPSLKDLVGKFKINGNLFDGSDSSLRAPGIAGSQRGMVTISDYFRANRETVMARVVTSTYTGGDPVTYLSEGFFEAGGGIDFPIQRRAIILIHEAVHAFANRKDQDFGGSGKLTEKIVDKCAPALRGHMGKID